MRRYLSEVRRHLRARQCARRARSLRRLWGADVAAAWATAHATALRADPATRAAEPCSPPGCQGWTIYDWEWWYFHCELPPCEAGAL